MIHIDKITDLITSKLQSDYIQNYFDDDEIRTIFDTLQSDVRIISNLYHLYLVTMLYSIYTCESTFNELF